jgi:hypothetical protein
LLFISLALACTLEHNKATWHCSQFAWYFDIVAVAITGQKLEKIRTKMLLQMTTAVGLGMW